MVPLIRKWALMEKAYDKQLLRCSCPPCEIYLNKKTFWIVIPERYSNCFMSRGLDELTPTFLMHVFQKSPYCVFDLFLIW